MNRIIMTTIILSYLILVCATAPATGAEVPGEIKLQNEQEKRLWEYRDTDEILAIKLENLKIINRDRARFGALPVKIDILAGRVANRHCRDMALNAYMSHWNMKGEKPYHRYAFAGGTDHVSENLASVTANYPLPQAPPDLLKRMNESEDQFMAEPPGSDGHKLNVIRKSHTHVGIGLYLHEGEFRYAQEFLDRYTSFRGINTVVPKGGKVSMSGLVIPPDTGIYAVLVYREKLTPMTVEQLNNTHSYSDYTDEKVFEIWPWDLSFNKESKTFDLTLDFNGKSPGYYYVHMYFKKPVSSIPYRMPSSADTTQAACATGIVLIHEAPVPPDAAALALTPSQNASALPSVNEATALPTATFPAEDIAARPTATAPAADITPSPEDTASGSMPTVGASTGGGMSFSTLPSGTSPSNEAGSGEGGAAKSAVNMMVDFLRKHDTTSIIVTVTFVILAVILLAVRIFRHQARKKTSAEEEQHFDY
ncbi:MAG: CAP domain-containing protein [Candidatus Xenobiia bacterium LiM19]